MKKKILILFAACLLIITPVLALAADNGTQICTPNQTAAGSGTNLGTCINNIYIFAIAFAGFVALIMFIAAGYMYMTGGESGVKKAKDIMTSTVVALVILFGAFALLNTLDPNLTSIRGVILPEVSCPAGGCAIGGAFGGTVISTGNGGSIVTGGTCNGCQDIGGPPYNLQTNGTIYADPALAARLAAVKNVTTNDPWYVTASYDPTGHISQCHQTGTCADIGMSGATTAQVADFCTHAKQAGLNVTNEFSQDASVVSACGSYQTFSTTTGPNLHVS